MSSTRCSLNAAAAVLSKVFVPPRVERVKSTRLPALALCSYPKPQARSYGMVRRYVIKEPGEKKDARGNYRLNRLPRDDEITHLLVHLREEDGTVSDPIPTHLVLKRLDPKIESLVVVALPHAGKDKHMEHPVCKVVNRKQERALEKERRLQQRKNAVRFKEMEINWAIDLHDLGHRLNLIRGFLRKGFKVEVLLMNRKNKRQATTEEAEEVLKQVREVINEVPGSKEARKSEGGLLEDMKLFFEGTQKKIDKNA